MYILDVFGHRLGIEAHEGLGDSSHANGPPRAPEHFEVVYIVHQLGWLSEAGLKRCYTALDSMGTADQIINDLGIIWGDGLQVVRKAIQITGNVNLNPAGFVNKMKTNQVSTAI